MFLSLLLSCAAFFIGRIVKKSILFIKIVYKYIKNINIVDKYDYMI